MSLPSEGQIKKRVGRVRGDTPRERLDQLWQLYLFWKSTPAGRREQEVPSHVRKVVRKAA
jgi:hypothetical protein